MRITWRVALGVLCWGMPSAAQTRDSLRAPSDTQPSPITTRTITEYLLGRVPGVLVYPSSGTVGTGARVRIRGPGSLLLPNGPAVYVDGIRVETDENGYTVSLGGQQPSRLNDLDPEEIDSVTVVRGPAAGVAWGPELASGAIYVWTRRAGDGRARWRAHLEQGYVRGPQTWPAKVGGVDADHADPTYGPVNAFCTLDADARGACALDFVRTFAPLVDRSQFRTAPRREARMALSGTAGTVRYVVGANLEGEGGIYELSEAEALQLPAGGLREDVRRPNHFERTTVGGRLAVALPRDASLDLWAGWTGSDVRLVANDNSILGLIGNGLIGQNDSTMIDGWGFFPPRDLFQILSTQRVHRVRAGGRLEIKPTAFLTATALFGIEETGVRDGQLQRNGEGSNFGIRRQGVVTDNHIDASRRTAAVSVAASHRLSDMIVGVARAGVRHDDTDRSTLLRNGAQLPPGATTVESAVIRSISESNSETGLLSVFVEQRMVWAERVTLTAGIRRDAPASGSATWHPALRAAWAASGPADLELFAGYGSASRVHDLLGLAERVREIEGGGTVGLRNGRARLLATLYDRMTSHALALVPVSSSSGIAFEVRSVGDVSDRGVELGLLVRVLDGRRVTADLDVSAWGNRNRLTRGTQAPYVMPDGLQIVAEGYPVGGYWQVPVGFTDANGDGVITLPEVVLGAEPAFLGTPFPTQGGALGLTLALVHRVRLGGRLEYRAGHHLVNQSAAVQCVNRRCAELYVAGSPLQAQANALAARSLGTLAGYIEDADFLKLREVHLSLEAPAAVLRALHTRSLTLTLIGRNLATWTGYTGIDPEVNALGQGPTTGGYGTADFFTQPPVRSFTLRLDIGY